MRARPVTWIAGLVAVLAVGGVLKSHQRRTAPTEPDQAAALAEDPWAAALSDEYAVPDTGPTPPLDPFVLSDLQFVIQNLRGLIADGQRTCADLGEPEYEPGAPGGKDRAQVQAWREFSRQWNADLDDAASSLPAPPDWDLYPNAALACEEIGRAINELRAVPVGTGEWPTPFESSWSSRFGAAEQLLTAAESRIVTTSP